jgi:hypothetical protein
MEGVSFWRDLEAQFEAAAAGADGLHAIHDRTDIREYAEEHSERLVAAVRHPALDPDTVYWMTRNAVRAAVEARRRKNPTSYWVVSVDGPDNVRREVLRAKFRSLAERASRAVGLADHAASSEDAEQVWLCLLAESDSPFLKYNAGWIDRLFEASALMCHQLGSRSQSRVQTQPIALDAVAASGEDVGDSSVVSSSRRPPTNQGSTLGRNLDHLRSLCNWTYEDMAAAVGNSRDSVLDHIKKGVSPRKTARCEYVQAINKKLGYSLITADLDDPDLIARLKTPIRS